MFLTNANLLPPPVESRSPTDTGQEQWLSVRSGDTRNPLSSSSASCPSSVLSVRSPRTSRLTCVSRAPPSWPSRKPARPTSLVCLRTPTCAPSTPSVWPSCPRTSSLPAVSVENVLNFSSLTQPNNRPFLRPPLRSKRDFKTCTCTL